ncbi:MAG: DNA repair and recombination protein RadA [Candidatus Hodarchaeales archaeon]
MAPKKKKAKSKAKENIEEVPVTDNGESKLVEEIITGSKASPKEAKTKKKESTNGSEKIADAKRITSVKELPGVGPSTAKKLAENGYETVMSLAAASLKELTAIAGIGETAARKIILQAQNIMELSFETADVILERRKELSRITTGSKALDELFGGGGVETGSMTELFGEFRTGKTQIAHQLCVTVQLPRSMGGLRDEDPDSEPVIAIYIDTEGTFRPERIVSMCERYKEAGIDPVEILKNIRVARAYNSDHQMSLTEKLARDAQVSNIKLAIVDSLTSHFRAEYMGRGELAGRQQKLNSHIHTLLRAAEVSGVSIIVTNQVSAKPDMFFGDPTSPVGGHVVGHASQTRVYLRKSKGNRRIARIYDSPLLPEGEAVFTITESGIIDDE